jgi:ABC-type transporter lipoprotein component MlaA
MVVRSRPVAVGWADITPDRARYGVFSVSHTSGAIIHGVGVLYFGHC